MNNALINSILPSILSGDEIRRLNNTTDFIIPSTSLLFARRERRVRGNAIVPIQL